MPWWIVDVNRRGNRTLFGPFGMRSLAEEYADDCLSSAAKLYELDTINDAEATRRLKARLVRKFKSVDEGMKRFKHSKRRSI